MSEVNTYLSCIINNDTTQSLALNSIICYSKISNNISKCTNIIYNSHNCIHDTCDFISYSFKYIFALLQNRHIEPLQHNWIRVSSVYFSTKYVYHYKYYTNDNINLLINNHELKKYSVGKNRYMCESWYTVKYENNISISRVAFSYDSLITTPSSIRFLTIEYIHPSMKERIQLTINNSWYITGNELLSFAMILHLLQEQSEDSYVFDKNYTINVMDNKIRMYELKHNEYILLDSRNFRILRT